MSSNKEKETKLLLPDREASPPAYEPTAAISFQQPKPQYAVRYAGHPPGDQFCMSIFTIFCCFMPFGIIALIKSMEARSAYQLGRHEEAAIALRSARTFNRWSIIVNVIVIVVVLIFQLAWIIPFMAVIAKARENHNDGYDHY